MSKKTTLEKLSITILLIVSLLKFESAFTQDSTYKTLKPVLLQASLLYDFPQSYGVTVAVSYPLKSIVKTRVSKSGTMLTRQKDGFWGLEAGGYRYPYNYTGILLMPFIGVRQYTRHSFFYETSLGVGVLRSFYDGKVYEVDADGNVKEKSLFGRFYATTDVSSAFNFLLQKPGHPILALQVKPTLWFQYPFNSFIKPHISFEAGINYEINTCNTTTRKMTKYLRE